MNLIYDDEKRVIDINRTSSLSEDTTKVNKNRKRSLLLFREKIT